MDKNSPQSNQPCRGIIVVDTTDLSTLSSPYVKKVVRENSPLHRLGRLKDGRGRPYATGSYLDLLPAVLAQQRYRIIIPEMVSRESAEILAGGKDIKTAFAQLKRKTYPTQDYVRHFCMNASGLNKNGTGYEQIEISKATPEDAMKDAVYPRYLRGYDIILDRLNSIRRHQEAYHGSLEHEGEKHCCDVIEKEIVRQVITGDERIPIFFLSADRGAREMLAEKIPLGDEGLPPVNVLAANGFLMAFENDMAGTVSALSLCGLPGTGEQQWESTIRQAHKNTDHIVPDYYDRNNPTPDYYDAPLGRYGTKEYPFAASMRGLARELVSEMLQRAAHSSPQETFTAEVAKSRMGVGSGEGAPGR